MRTVDIRNLEEARVLHPNYDAVVSVIENRRHVDKLGHPRHIVEVMGDFDRSMATWGKHNNQIDEFPRKEQFEQILGFVNSLPKNAKILVHCAAGISRSTATGLGILANEGMEEEEAVRLLANKHPRNRAFWPNDMILGHFDEILCTELEAAAFPKRHTGNVWELTSNPL